MKTSPTVQIKVLSAVLYGICSGSMNFLNKFLLTSWGFHQPAFIMLVQLLINVTVIKLLKTTKRVEVCSYNKKTATSCALLSTLYSANALLALIALNGMNVPMYICLRRCTPLFSMVLGFFWFSKRPTQMTFLSIVVITAGTLVATAGDLTFAIVPYALGTTSVVFMAFHLLVLKQSSVEKELSAMDLLYVNSANCIPILLFFSILNLKGLMMFPNLYEVGFLLSFLLVASVGCIFNYSLFLCTTVNSALTTSWAGVVKSGFTTVIGMFTFGGVVPTPLLLTGLSMNFFGCVMYAFSKYLQSKAAPIAPSAGSKSEA